MKRYRYITLSLLLLLLSLSSLSAQKTFPQWDQPLNGTYEIKTWPSYCLNEGAISIRLKDKFSRPLLEQLEKVEYDVRDMEGHTYTEGYREAPAPGAALLVSELTGGKEYEIYIRITPLPDTGAKVIESKIQAPIKIEDKYVGLVVVKDTIDLYRLPCRPYGSFHIVARGGTQRPPVLNIKQAPATFTGAKKMQPTKQEVKGDTTLYHFEYSGALPQGTYEYTLESDCRETTAKSFAVYGPTTNLPTVPSDLKIPFVVSQMERKGCEGSIFEFAASSSDKPFLHTLFEAINKGYQGKSEELFPEFVDSFPSLFSANYEVVVVSQQEYKMLQQGKLDASTLLWSEQKGSLTTLTGGRGKGDPSISYKLPQAMSIQELGTQQALPGALLIRVKRPNEGCDEYITIPISVDLNFRGGASFRTLEAEDLSDCSIGQIVWFQVWNFCKLRIKYYELPEGADKPAPGAQPVHTSEEFGPSVSTMVEKQYTFAGYDPKKRYYVELDIIDLEGNPVTPKPSLILAPQSKKPVENRLYNFSSIYSRLSQFFAARSFVGDHITFLSPTSGTYLAMSTTKDNYNPIRGMEITLVQAPEGYEEFQRVREDFYFRKPDPSNQSNPYGGGMIRLGETIRISNDYRLKGLQSPMGEVFPFHFIYKEGKNGERVVYSYTKFNVPTPLKEPFVEPDDELEQYFWDHPMPKGIYRFKFEHPCQPGESFYIDLDMNEPDFKPELTDLIDPVVDRTSCDTVRVYPFADGRLDYAVDKEGKPRKLIFLLSGRPEDKGKYANYIYFFPYDRKDNPIDHTKFYIPVKSIDLPLTIRLRYYYPQPNWQWIEWHKKSYTSVDPVGVNQFVKGELERKDVNPSYYKLPLPGYDPTDDQKDWGRDGISGAWSAEPFNPWVFVDVPIDTKDLTPSYARPTYVGYRCSKETGYMAFKLINIPNKVGTVVLKDGDKVIMSSNIEDLPEDLMVKWELNAESGSELKNEYRLEIKTSLCGETNMQTEKFTVKLEDISEGIAVTVSPQSAHCPGDVVTLTASNLGVPDSAYKWTFDNGDTDSGRTIRRKVSAPRVVDGKAHYESYTLTVNGTRCGTNTSKGTISVSPDELWWMPDLTGQGGGTMPPGPDEEETPTEPNPSSSDAKYYDWHNPDNWVFLHDGKFYPAKAVPTRCTNVHIMNLSQFELGPVGSKLRAQPDLAKEVTPRDLYGEPTCIDITFHSGASVFNIQQLNYRRAMVRYNFGVADGTSYDSDRHIYTTEEVNTDEWMYGRDELNLLSAPLYDIYAGDYSFSASPYTYQLGFKAVPAGNSTVAQFDASAFNDPSPLQSISMAGNNNSIALIVAGDEQGFKSREGKSAIVERHGILELPYFDRPDVAKPFYHQTYDASTGQTRFQYFDGKAKRFRGYYSYAQRSKMAYRFIFEDPTTQRIAKLADGTEGYTMDVSATAAGQEVMVGNPFMAPLEVVPFLEANKEVIEPYVRILDPASVKGYEPLKLDGSVKTYPQITAGDKKINPLGAFVVKLKSGVGPEAQLVFPTTALDSYAKQYPQSSSSLRNTSGDATAETARYLSLTLQSRLGKDRALVAYGYESGSVDKMLLSTESRYPSIAIVDPADGLHKDLYADDAATGHYELATQVSEPIDVTLSLAGSVMGHVVTARLIDHKSGLEHDLTGGKSCQIKLFPDDAEGRLELRVDGDFTSVAPMVEPTAELQAQYSEGMLTVRTTAEMSSLRLVQGDGITVYTQSLPGLTEYSERILLSSGSYVVEAIGTDGVARRATLVVR